MMWRVLDTLNYTAAEHIALDKTLLELKAQNKSPNTIRFLKFSRPCVLVGYNQVIEHEVRVDECRKLGVEINRRVTGGGAIYFDTSSIGWEIVADKSIFPRWRLEEVYRTIGECIARALRKLGVPASFRPRNDIEVNGRKISGTGGVEQDSAFLFQGTLLIDFDVKSMVRVLRVPVKKLSDKEIASIRERVTDIKRELGYIPPYSDIKSSIVEELARTFSVESLEEEGLSAEEKDLYQRLLPYFKSNEWVFQEKRPVGESAVISLVEKLEGGLIRVSLAIDEKSRVIKQCVISGDFFAHPPKVITDLEAMLKFTRASRRKIREITREVFRKNNAEVLKISPDDLAELIWRAVEKIKLKKLGLSLEEVNYVSVINCKLSDVVDKRLSYRYLLLPYCSKKINCKYRRKEGCTKCGECDVGLFYELAEKTGFKVITIQNFEHLVKTLREIREKNCGWIGSCCEAFYCKHIDELKQTNTPGVIVDLNSENCYDLGKADEAYRGEFENQTQLRCEILKKFLAALT